MLNIEGIEKNININNNNNNNNQITSNVIQSNNKISIHNEKTSLLTNTKTKIPMRQHVYLICTTITIVIFLSIISIFYVPYSTNVNESSDSLTSFHLPQYNNNNKKTIGPCEIYCYGPLLHTIQTAFIFPDNKYFVDMPMKDHPEIIYKSFLSLPNYNRTTLIYFINKYFNDPETDLDKVVPLDFKECPTTIMNMTKNETLKKWAMDLNQLWKSLGRKPRETLDLNRHSLLPTKYMLIVPGGRFRESYYWDSYWIIHGLLVCEMKDTAKGIILNLLDFVKKYGFVPNGGRIYYLTRSQPPVLSEMIRAYLKYDEKDIKKDINLIERKKFIEYALPLLEKEYAYWMIQGNKKNNYTGHSIKITSPYTGKKHTLNRYMANTKFPRPESYDEDIHTADFYSSKKEKEKIYQEIASGAETGWDFSSRWLKEPKNLYTIQTTNIIPVDLNIFLYRMEKNIQQLFIELKNYIQIDRNYNKTKSIFSSNYYKQKIRYYHMAALARQEAIQDLLYNKEKKMWQDYIISDKMHSKIISVSCYIPLWANFGDLFNLKEKNEILDSFKESGLIQVGGIRTTTVASGQQWDSPNAWAPMQDIMTDGLLKLNTSESIILAKSLTQRWLRTNLMAWQDRKAMFEKYNAFTNGHAGYGGEYEIQKGFGWTNGVVLKMLAQKKFI